MEEFLYDRFDILALVLAVDDYFVHFVRQLVAQHALEQADVLVYEARRAVLLHPVLNLAPLGDEVLDVAAQALDVAVLGDGPDDYAEAFGPYLLRHGAQPRALFVARDALRNARLVPAGNQHHVAPRKRYARRYARALALARVLDDLHEHIHAGAHIFAPDVVEVEEAVAPVAEVEERRVHTRQHAVDARLVYLARALVLEHTLYEEVAELSPFVRYRNPRLLGVDEVRDYFFRPSGHDAKTS